MAMETFLDELNTLLKTSKLDVPSYMREVYPSGKNLKWLKKNFANAEGVNARLQELLKCHINQLNAKK